jgi:hypothetical protein
MIKKKSQMEIMGIVIIVILFSVGLLFAIRYVILKPEVEVKKSFIQAEQSSNTLNSMLKTNVLECKGADMSDLFKDCAGITQEIDCENDGTVYTDAVLADSCFHLNHTISTILSNTLNKWRVPFAFSAFYDGQDPLEWTEGITSDIELPCTMESEGRPQEFTLPTNLGSLRIVLKIC